MDNLRKMAEEGRFEEIVNQLAGLHTGLTEYGLKNIKMDARNPEESKQEYMERWAGLDEANQEIMNLVSALDKAWGKEAQVTNS